MVGEVAIWEQPEFEGTSLIPTSESVTGLSNPQPLVGRENVAIEDLIVPSLALLQGQSDAVTSGVPGAVPGLLMQTNTGEIIKPPLKCIVVHYHKTHAFFPQMDKYPEAKGKKPCMSRDTVRGNRYGICEECGICTTWMDDGRPPMGARNHVFTVMTNGGPATIRFSRSYYKNGSKFLSNWGFSSNNLWDFPVIVGVHPEPHTLDTGKKTTYQTLVMHWMTAEPTPEPWRVACQAMFDKIESAHEAGKFGDELDEVEDKPPF